MSYQTAHSLDEFDLARYAREGVAVLKGYLTQEPEFQRYLNDLKWCARTLLRERGSREQPDSLESALLALHRLDGKEVQHICHLATLPTKLASGGALKHHPRLLALVERAFGEGAVIGSPAGSDTLHVFAGDPLFDRYILPIHQDYPYLLFSPKALTLWIPMVPFSPGAGGMAVWPGSHALGIHTSTKSPLGHFQTVISEAELARFPRTELAWDVGDVVIMDTHMLHQGIANRTPDHLRVTQLFRYADLADARSIASRWRTAVFARPGDRFEQVHADLYVEPADYQPKNLFN